uniref:MEKK4_N domain-containing protein n=1 Tax=Steinernema glaseri TaxID=37863 RepID=A0A1I7ZTA2_9BILA
MEFRSRRGSESDLSYQSVRKSSAEKGDKAEKKRKKGYAGRASLPCHGNKRKYSKGSKIAYEFGDEMYLYEQEHVAQSQPVANSPRFPTSPVQNAMPKYSCLPLGRDQKRLERRGHCFMQCFNDEPSLIPETLPETKQEDPELSRQKEFYQTSRKELNDAKRQKNKRIEQLEVVSGENCEIRGETLKAYVKVTDYTTAKMGDVLWLQLQAYLAGRPMTKEMFANSTNVHDAYVLKERQKLGGVIEDIRRFTFEMSEQLKAQLADRNSYLKTVHDDSYLVQMRSARTAVETLLNRFDQYWSLFPRFKAIFPRLEGDGIRAEHKEVIDRLELLYMWYNTLDSLRDVMKTVGEILRNRSANVSASNGARSSRSSTDTFNFWPRDDYHSPTQSWAHVSYSDIGGRLSPCDSGLSKSPELDEQNMDVENEHEFEKFLRKRYLQFYQDVVQQSLQLRGMREVLNQIDRVTRRPLDKAAAALVSRPLYAHVASGSNLLSGHVDHELKKHDMMTVHHKHFAQMNLPPFLPFFLFLITVPVDLVEQWCAAKSMRTDSERGAKRDLLTINTLIEECHECLTAAIDVKLQYVGFVKATCADPSAHLSYLRALDNQLDQIFMNYFEYLFEWADSGSDFTSNDMEWNSATHTVDKLISEWQSTKEWTVSISSTESEAARRFCHISKKVLNDLVLKFLQSEVEKIDRMAIEAKLNKNVEADFEIVDEGGNTPERKLSAPHSLVFMQCRRIKRLIQNLRQRSLKALALLKAVSNDLEFCAKYKAKLDAEIDGEYIARKLIENDFILLRFKTGYELPFLAFCPKEIQNNSEAVNSLLNSICSRVCKLPPDSSKSKREQHNESQSLETEGSLDPFNFDSLSQAMPQVTSESSPKNYLVIVSRQLFASEDFNPYTETPRCVEERFLSDIEIRKSTATSLAHTKVR